MSMLLTINAEKTVEVANNVFLDSVTISFLAVIAVLALTLYILYSSYIGVFKSLFPTAIKERRPSEKSVILEHLTSYVPLDKEQTILMDHEYDGIRELDNDLPPWLMYTFYVTATIAICYFTYYEVLGGPGQIDEYKAQVDEHKKMIEDYRASHPDIMDESTVTLLTSSGAIESGKMLFDKSCVTCHGAGATGLNGPNLTDKYWLYGATVGDVFKTIQKGVIENGMPEWGSKLSPEEIQKVSSYILSLDPVGPPNGKEPQGEEVQ